MLRLAGREAEERKKCGAKTGPVPTRQSRGLSSLGHHQHIHKRNYHYSSWAGPSPRRAGGTKTGVSHALKIPFTLDSEGEVLLEKFIPFSSAEPLGCDEGSWPTSRKNISHINQPNSGHRPPVTLHILVGHRFVKRRGRFGARRSPLHPRDAN